MKDLIEDLAKRHEQRMGQVYIPMEEQLAYCQAMALMSIAVDLTAIRELLASPPVIVEGILGDNGHG